MLQKLKGLSGKALLSALLYILIKWSLIATIGTFLIQNNLWKNEYYFILPVIGLTYLGAKTLYKKYRKAS